MSALVIVEAIAVTINFVIAVYAITQVIVISIQIYRDRQ